MSRRLSISSDVRSSLINPSLKIPIYRCITSSSIITLPCPDPLLTFQFSALLKDSTYRQEDTPRLSPVPHLLPIKHISRNTLLLLLALRGIMGASTLYTGSATPASFSHKKLFSYLSISLLPRFFNIIYNILPRFITSPNRILPYHCNSFL